MIIIVFWQTTNISWLGLVDGESWSIMVNILPVYWSSRERERETNAWVSATVNYQPNYPSSHKTLAPPPRLPVRLPDQHNIYKVHHHTTSQHQPSCLLCTPTVLTLIKGRSLKSPESRNRASFGVQKESSGFQKLGKGWKVKSPDIVWMKIKLNLL